MVQETTSPPVTDQPADHVQVSEEYDVFLEDNKRPRLMHSDVKRISDPAILRYEANTLKEPTDRIDQNPTQTVLVITAKEATKIILVLCTELWTIISSWL